MNPEREFRFANRIGGWIAGRIISLQLFIEDNFLYPPDAIVLSLDDVNDKLKEEWMEEFRRILND